MTPHENALILIKKLNYNSRQVAEVLRISTKGAENKMKQIGSNQFLEKDYHKLLDFIKKLQITKKNLD